MIIPDLTEEVFAKKYGVTIPIGADNPNQKIHYLPSEVTVQVNDVVQWSNFDVTTHTVTSGSFQGGPDGLFNSGLLEPNEIFIYQTALDDIGKLTYYCTIHPWMNGIVTVLDPEGLPVGRVAEAGSISAARNHVSQARQFEIAAKGFVNTSEHAKAAESFSEAAKYFHNAAVEFSLLDDNENSALYYKQAAIQFKNAALEYEQINEFTKSVIALFETGVEYHSASVQYGIINDLKNMGLNLSEAFKHKGMAKYGSDYVLPPKHQARYILDVSDISCKKGYELVLKSTSKEPVCLKASSVAKLVGRGWATTI